MPSALSGTTYKQNVELNNRVAELELEVADDGDDDGAQLQVRELFKMEQKKRSSVRQVSHDTT